MFFNGQKTLHPEDKESRDKQVKDALNRIKELITQFRVVWNKNGEVGHIRAVATVLRNDAGDPLRMVGVNFDITDRLNPTIAIENQNKRLKDIALNIPLLCEHM